MSRPGTRADTLARMELLKARAAIERHELRQGMCRVRASLSPGSLVKEALPVFGRGEGPLDLLLRALGFARRYPFLLSGVSALFSGRSRRPGRWIKLAGGLLLGWQLSRRLKSPGIARARPQGLPPRPS